MRAVAAVAAAIALAVLLPLLGRGFVLTYDMVFTPRQYLLPDTVGLGSALPRAVPSDAVVAIATWLIPGDVVQKLLLALALFAGALGAGRLVPTNSTATRIVAATTYGWSAYVAERLLIGHWQLLLTYACLPWITHAALALRRNEPKAAAKLILACAPAMLTPTGGLIAAVAAMAYAGTRRITFTLPAMVVLNAPWWVPAVLHPNSGLSTPDAIAAFAPRTESWGTPVTSLLGLGGIWNSDATPTSRENPLIPLLTLAIVTAALFGLRQLAQHWGKATRAFVLLGTFGIALAALNTIPFGQDLLRWLTIHLPGAGLLRDSQRFVAWWAIPLAIGFALAVEQATRYLRTPAARRAILAAAAILPVAIMPDLAWAALGKLDTANYPDDWAHTSTILANDTRPGDVLALPLSTFRQFGWNANRTQLDPAPRALPRPTVTDDTLIVDGHPLPGEDIRSRQVRETLENQGDLTRLGIGWLLVEHGTPGPTPLPPGLTEVYRGPWLSVYRLPGDVTPPNRAGPPRAPVLAADLTALTLLMAALLWRVLPTGKLSRAKQNATREQPCA